MKFITVYLTKSNYKKILLKDILYIEAKGDYVRIVTKEFQCTTHSTLKNISEIVGASFFRIHRSFLANIENVTDIKGSTVVVGGITLPISKDYRSEFLNEMNLVSSLKESINE